MEMHEDTHARLPLRRSDTTVNGRNMLTVDVSTVIECHMVDDTRNVAGKLAPEVLWGCWR